MALIERDHELRRIDELLAGAIAGRGGAALIEGAPGIGKTALLTAATEQATTYGLRTLVACGGELERDFAFVIVRQLFEAPLRAADPALREDLLGGAAALAVPVFNGVPPHGGTPIVGGASASPDPTTIGAVLHGLYWLCSNLAERGPLLLAVDDVHWADEASLRFLSYLARRIVDLPVLLLLAGRPPGPNETDPVGELVIGLRSPILRLEPLSDAGVGALVRATLSPTADDVFCQACARISGGNPFLLAEALASLRIDGVVPDASQASRLDRIRPETISRAVLARVARLGPDAVRLAQAVAVLGPAAELRRTAQLAGVDTERAASLVDSLAHEAIVIAGRPIEFAHPLVRTAIYADAPVTRRAVAHRNAARLLAAEGVAAEELAPHLLMAEPDADPWIVETLRTAARGALARGAPEPAATYLERALAEPPPPAQRGAVLVELGRTQSKLNRPGEAVLALEAALALADTPRDELELTLELGTLMVMTGQGRRFTELFERVQALRDQGDSELPLRILAGISIGGLTAVEDPGTWITQLDRVAPGLDGTSGAERMVLGILAFGAAATGDRPAHEVARLASRAAAGPPPEDDPGILVNLTSAALAIASRTPEALHLLDQGIDTARYRGDITAFAYLSVLRSHTAFEAGRLLDAEADGWAAVHIYQDQPQDAPVAAAVLIDALVERGDLTGAEEVLNRWVPASDQPLSMLIAHFIHVARARLRLRQQRPRDALADLVVCGEGLAAAGYRNPGFAHWRAEAALAHLALGELDAAHRYAAEELTLARPFGASRALGIALRVSGLVEGGTTGLALLAEAVAVLDDSPAELERARALIDYGAALRRANQRTAAQESLRRGLDLATRCGATVLAGRAGNELLAAGARPRRTVLTGPEALTSAEVRVARMAADGLTNREIGQALFITKRTVEVHLTNAYRKLGITSRQELRVALDQRNPPLHPPGTQAGGPA